MLSRRHLGLLNLKRLPCSSSCSQPSVETRLRYFSTTNRNNQERLSSNDLNGSQPTHTIISDAVQNTSGPLEVPAQSSGSFISSCADAFLTIPSVLPSQIGYTTTIVLATLLLRSSITLPLTIWSRKRVKRVADFVVPEVKEWSLKARYSLRTEYRRQNKSYEEYVKELNKRTKQQFKIVARKYRCTPLPTMLVPPLVHLPIFISSTLILREACTKSLSALTQAGQASPGSPGLPASLAVEGFAWCPSLAEVDPYTYLPLAVALTALTNVEIQTAIRSQMAKAQAEASDEPADVSPTVPVNPRQKVQKPTRPPAVAHAAVQKRGLSSTTLSSDARSTVSPPPPQKTATPEPPTPSSIRSKAITNVLRFASLLFLPVAAFAPTAVNLYWLTSNCYSIVQNMALGYIDRKRNRQS